MAPTKWAKPGVFLLLIAGLAFCAYAGSRAEVHAGPTLSGVRATAKTGKAVRRGPSANVGQEIRLIGSGFPDNASVEFTAFANSTFTVKPNRVEPRRILVAVPPESVSASIRVVTPDAGMSSAHHLQIVPSIQTLSSATVKPGDRLLIDGAGFSPDAKVIFKGVASPVAPTIVSPERVDVVVPAGVKTGPVVVLTNGGRSKPVRLTVQAVPVIPKP